jgi:hypothetical protein
MKHGIQPRLATRLVISAALLAVSLRDWLDCDCESSGQATLIVGSNLRSDEMAFLFGEDSVGRFLTY